MSKFLLLPARPEKPAGLDAECFLVDREASGGAPILVVSFTGTSPDGSAGRAHAAFVACSTMCGLHAFEPWAVVLDFRRLEYRWGNSMLRVFQDISRFMDAHADPGSPPFPVIPVVSERSAGFQSLLRPAGDAAAEPLTDDLDVAIETAIVAANRWIDA